MPIQRVSKEELKQRLEIADASAPVVLDARLKYPYEHSTVKLPAAIRVAPDAIDAVQIPKGRDLVVYDSDPGEVTASHVAAELVRRGYTASALKGGIAEWMAANFPVEHKESARPTAPAPGALK